MCQEEFLKDLDLKKFKAAIRRDDKKAQIKINAANRRFQEEDEGTAIDRVLGRV